MTEYNYTPSPSCMTVNVYSGGQDRRLDPPDSELTSFF